MRRTIKIIVADDQSLFRKGVRSALASRNDIIVIGEAENGQDLLQKLEYLQPDIIILNINMPILNGVETLPILKKKYPAIKVIILSFVSDPGIIRHMMEQGANAYLTKDAGSEEINEAILACHKNWLYINETVRNALTNMVVGIPEKPPFTYTTKELKILKFLRNRKTTNEIGVEVDLTQRSVEALIDRLKAKTATKSVEELIGFAINNKLIES